MNTTPDCNTNLTPRPLASDVFASRNKLAACWSALAAVACCAASLFGSAVSLHAANLITTNTQPAGNDWTAAIWKTNGAGTAVGNPVVANTYEMVGNGRPYGPNTSLTTIVRDAYGSTAYPTFTFGGASLTVGTNTEFRFCTGNNNSPYHGTNVFPGVSGNAGLILNGGALSTRQGNTYAHVAGIIRVDTPSFLSHANNGGGNPNVGCAWFIDGALTGSGDLVCYGGLPTSSSNVVTSASNTFSGQWFLKAGLLVGSGTNSLGTNSITVDPNYTLPFTTTVTTAGPAIFEVNYDHVSAGTLTLANGGQMRLHQNCWFTAATINGTPLAQGAHSYAELRGNFPGNFPAGGSGYISIQNYGLPTRLPPVILTQPQPETSFSGATAQFSVVVGGSGPFSYFWRTSGVKLNDGGNISGSATANLTVSNVSAANALNYDVVITNAAGPITSTVAPLTLITPSGNYETAVLAANPAAFYLLNETIDPSTGNAPVIDSWGGLNGFYGATVQNGFNGVQGPMAADGFPGLGTGNAAAQFVGAGSATVNPWKLNTNTVTITAWVKPAVNQASGTGVVLGYNGTVASGLRYSAGLDAGNNNTLGYIWDGEPSTSGWNSGLVPPIGQWSFVALVVTPTNVTIHVMNTSGMVSSSRAYSHLVQGFGSSATLGNNFNGVIDNVAVFSSALSPSQLTTIFQAGTGSSNNPLYIGAQPVSQTLYAQQTAQFAVIAGGTPSLSYQWQASAAGAGVFTNLVNGGRISGAQTPTLTIATAQIGADNLDYQVIVTNSSGSVTSSVATLSLNDVGPATAFTLSGQEAQGSDWDSINQWSFAGAVPPTYGATTYAAARPGSTFEVLAGGRLRTPTTPNIVTFPGNILTISGNGVYTNNPAAGSAIGELWLKQANPGTVIFPKLVMNGGEINAGNPWLCVVGGEIDILANTPIYQNDAADSLRSIQVSAWLTGSGSIEYHGSTYNPTYANTLNLTCTSNTFNGTWNVAAGTLLGSGYNSLGTNTITVGASGSLETAYDMVNTNASLVLNGRMYLHQNDTFRSVVVDGVPLNVGTYSFAALNSAYPTNFPASWTLQTGSSVATGSGSITVLATPPVILTQPVSQTLYAQQTAQLTVSAVGSGTLYYQWWVARNGVFAPLADGGQISGSKTTNLTITAIGAGNATNYYFTVTNSYGMASSTVVTLTVLPVGPAENITLSVVEAVGESWDTTNRWSDTLPASLSAASKPGSTYEVLPGGRLRTPPQSALDTFPGNILTVKGDGVYVNNPTNATIGEIWLKSGNPGTVIFPKLVMNGGQIDAAQNVGMCIVGGEVDILTNTPIYNNAGDGSRSIRLDAWLTGGGSIEYHGNTVASANTNAMNLTCASNTFNGTWNVDSGAVLGSGLNSLGTNNITVGTNGAIETTYDLHNPQGSLFLNGKMFLHQHNSFATVVISNGPPLAAGTYTFAQLNAAYPSHFPAVWTQQNGSAYSTGSGSITVGNAPPTPPPPQFTSVVVSGGSIILSGTNAPSVAGYAYDVYRATNVDTPRTDWILDGTGNFDINGFFNYTNTLLPGAPRQFYIIRMP